MLGTLMLRKIFPIILTFTITQLAWADGEMEKYQQTPPETPQPVKEQPPAQPEQNNVQAQKSNEPAEKKEAITMSSGFGLLRAYKGRKDLHASGGAEIKATYPMGLSIGDFPIVATFRYMPFNVAPNMTVRDVEQDYRGIIETFNLGAEADLSFDPMFDFIVSLEAGLIKSNFDKMIPVVENEWPLKKAGMVFFFSSEARFKPLDRFYLGPKLSLGAGEFTSWNLFVNATFILL